MSHYFINDDKLKQLNITFDYTFKDNRLIFHSDSGVFSRNRVDYGTNILLNNLPSLANYKIIDVGCGVGVIGLAIAKAYPNSEVTLVDINSKAVELSVKNAEANKIKNVSVIESDIYSNVIGTYDVIISNPPIRAGKKVINKIVEDGYNKLNFNGKIYLVIQKKQGAPSMREKLITIFHNCEEIAKKNGYYVFCSNKETL